MDFTDKTLLCNPLIRDSDWERRAHHLSVPHDRADVIEGRQGLLHLEPSQEQPQTALEPGQGAAGEFFKGPMVGVGLFLGFFSSGVG